MKHQRKSKKSLLCGLGLDGKDGHVRLTRGKNFFLVGGSQDTHCLMQEKAVKFNEQLDKRHKTLEEINEKEFGEIGEKIGLKTAVVSKPLLPRPKSDEDNDKA